MNRPELLAPAGGWDALVAAVQNGADAVYLGGRQFNARRGADNFDLEQIAAAVDYAHLRGVKIYVTVNILLADTELREAVRFLRAIYNTGADAAIVQDLGLIRLARRAVPELELHASTQMTAHNLPGVEFLRDAGLKRVVLARELDLDSIRRIREQAGIQLETFVHGALCVCYSGQCLMSSLIGGRSGNRGRCAQPCRLEYRLVDAGGRTVAEAAGLGEYLLSPRDLNLSRYIPRLIEAGIDSFKIEGRMRRPEYVATVVRVYRALIDRAAAGEEFSVTGTEAVELAQIFNRGFTTGYFFGHPGRELMSFKRPNNRGILLGRVKRYNRHTGRVEIELEAPLAAGDGVEVWVTRGGRVGAEVHNLWVKGRQVESAPAGAVVEIELAGHVRPGDRVFKTHDAALMHRALQSYSSSRETLRIPLDMRVRARVGEPLLLEADDRKGVVVRACTNTLGEPARKRPLTAGFLASQLDRLGNTPFVLGLLECDIEGEVMLPVSEINEVRRQVVEKIARERVRSSKPKPLNEEDVEHKLKDALAETGTPPRRFPRLAAAVSGAAGVRAAVAGGAEIVYYTGAGFRGRGKARPGELAGAREFCRRRGAAFIPVTPRILHDAELARYRQELEELLALEPDGVMLAGYGMLPVLREITELPLAADFSLNVFNRQSVLFLAEKGLFRVTLSPELTGEQVRELAAGVPVETELIVHGTMPLMVSRYCAPGSLLGGMGGGGRCSAPCGEGPYALLDRKGVLFPVETDSHCLMHVFNSRELCLLDALPSLVQTGLAVLRIEARREEPGQVTKSVRTYRRVLDALREDQQRLPDLEAAVCELTAGGPGYTRGHYYRGVMD